MVMYSSSPADPACPVDLAEFLGEDVGAGTGTGSWSTVGLDPRLSSSVCRVETEAVAGDALEAWRKHNWTRQGEELLKHESVEMLDKHKRRQLEFCSDLSDSHRGREHRSQWQWARAKEHQLFKRFNSKTSQWIRETIIEILLRPRSWAHDGDICSHPQSHCWGSRTYRECQWRRWPSGPRELSTQGNRQFAMLFPKSYKIYNYVCSNFNETLIGTAYLFLLNVESYPEILGLIPKEDKRENRF
jgi:hypothetical protein